MEFIINVVLSLFITFIQWIIGYGIITFLLDGAFTIADIIIILWVIGQIIYFYHKTYYQKNKASLKK